MIHDAVRPFVTQEVINQNVIKAIEVGAVDTCIPSMDTLVYASGQEMIQSIPNRCDYFRGQTPQSFSYSSDYARLTASKAENSSDDCQLVLDLGHPVGIVDGDEYNIKITSGLDLFFAEQLIRHHFTERKMSFADLARSTSLCDCRRNGRHRKGDRKPDYCSGRRGDFAGSPDESDFHRSMQRHASIEEAFEKIAKQFGPIDGLINSAGYLSVASLEGSHCRKSINLDVNLKGLILCCQKALLKKGAHVINIASSSFSRGRGDMVIYSSAKAGVVNFTQGWAEERSDLHIHAVIPQRTNTSMRRINFPKEDLANLLDPADVAQAVVDLLMQNDVTGLLVEVRKNSVPL